MSDADLSAKAHSQSGFGQTGTTLPVTWDQVTLQTLPILLA